MSEEERAALPLIVNSVKRQAAFAAAAHTGKHYQFILWYADVNILQVVLPCTKHFNKVVIDRFCLEVLFCFPILLS